MIYDISRGVGAACALCLARMYVDSSRLITFPSKLISPLPASLYISFPSRMSYESFIIGIAFFMMGYMIEKFVLKQ